MEPNVVSQDSPKLLDRMRAEIRVRHYSIRTEETYLDWARRFILYHNKQHPKDMGADEVQAFLSYLALERNVSSSTQGAYRFASQALAWQHVQTWLQRPVPILPMPASPVRCVAA